MRLRLSASVLTVLLFAMTGALTFGLGTAAADSTAPVPPPLSQGPSATFQSPTVGRPPSPPPPSTVSVTNGPPLTDGPRPYDTLSADRSLARLISSAHAAHARLTHPVLSQPGDQAGPVSSPHELTATTVSRTVPPSVSASISTAPASLSFDSPLPVASLPAKARGGHPASGTGVTALTAGLVVVVCAALGTIWFARRRNSGPVRGH